MVYYLTTFYRRNELALRIFLFYGAATIAGAFSGLIPYGVFQIHHSTVPGWKFLMIVQGGSTVMLALFAYWYLPSDVKKCDWFTQVERDVAEDRMLRDSSTVVNEDFSFKKSLGQLLHWTTLCNALIGLAYGSAAATVGNWIPVLVKSLVSEMRNEVLIEHTADMPLTGLLNGQDKPLHRCPLLRRDCRPLGSFHVIRPLPRTKLTSRHCDDNKPPRLHHPRCGGRNPAPSRWLLCLLSTHRWRVRTFLHPPRLA